MCLKSSSDSGGDVAQTSQVSFMNTLLTQSVQQTGVDQNFLSCPVGTLLLLSTLFSSGAARGRTGAQIGRALQLKSKISDNQLGDSMGESKALYTELADDLRSQETFIDDQRVNVMTISNGLFTRTGYNIKPTFEWSFKTEFHAYFKQLDFANQSESARQINSWVNSETRGKIPRFFNNPSELPADSRIALFNVFTFKDTWQRPFLKSNTLHNQEFMIGENRRSAVSMMMSEEILPYATFADKGFSMIRKPLQNYRFSLVVLLPTTKWDMAGVNKVLSGEYSVKQLMRTETELAVSLKLPTLHLKNSVSLIPILTPMGVEDLFTRGRADLSGITDSEKLYISLMKQATTLIVNEAGVEAAAVTGAVAVPTSLIRPEVEFHVTHPFVCMIYDEQLHVPLVAARVFHPSER